MEGFTLKCNECGKETIVTMNSEGEIIFENGNVNFGCAGYDGELGIACICGNKFEED